MTAAIAFVRAFWKPLVALACAAMIWFAIHHFGAQKFTAGYQQAVSENAKTVAKKQVENAKKEAADAKQIADAYRARDEIEAELAILRAQPRTGIVCRHASSPERVPSATRLPEAETPGPGALPRTPESNPEPAEFNPTDELYALIDEADDQLASCRTLHQAVHGIPSTLPARVPGQ